MLALSVLDAALDAFDGLSLEDLRAHSLALTDRFIAGLDDMGLDVVTPREHERRGSQVSFRHPQAYGVVQALIARGVIGDFREDGDRDGIARFGFAPLYLTLEQVDAALAALGEVLAGQEHLSPSYADRRAVT